MNKGIRVFGTLLIIYGVYNLLGIGNYKQFAIMFKGWPSIITIGVYAFSILYGICAVYCGTRILKFEDWARKVMVGLTLISVILGFIFNRTVMTNFRDYLFSQAANVPPELVEPVYRYMMVFTALVTIFELSIIIFFTRRNIINQFREHA